jgi:Phosphotransferase enzyme family
MRSLGTEASLRERLRRGLAADTVELEQKLQRLWGGYGELWRARVTRGSSRTSVIVKHVHPPRDDHGRSHRRKLRSYDVERAFYRDYAERCLSEPGCRVPRPLLVTADPSGWLFALEDLDAAGFDQRRALASAADIAATLRWLAQFHARFLGAAPRGLWNVGTYWHLATRPDELTVMRHPALRRAAGAIDARLNGAHFKTWVHGDAKLENVCFDDERADVALVDFQYVGAGVGVKDVAYFLSSCLSPSQCASHAELYLDQYFVELGRALSSSGIDRAALEQEWRALFPFAWADFQRFMLGWAPGQGDLDPYGNQQVERVLRALDVC